MIDRRSLIAGFVCVPSTLRPQLASALQSCNLPGLAPGMCSAMIDPQKFDGVPAYQQNSQWCWAACISMICKWHGYSISQTKIVEGIYGGAVNMPASDEPLTRALNHTWTDDNGRSFRISADTFSPVLGTSNVSNERVIDDLQNDRPLLNGSRTHATVVARVDYFKPPNQPPAVARVHVIDPWPGAAQGPQMARFLAADEMTAVQRGGSLRYLASIRISAA